MNYEKILKLQKDNLRVSKKNLEAFYNKLSGDVNNEALRLYVKKREEDIKNTEKIIFLLEQLIELEDNFKKRKQIRFTDFNNVIRWADGTDANYEKVYKLEKELLELNYAYLNKKGLRYKERIINFNDSNYSDVYSFKKKNLLKKQSEIGMKVKSNLDNKNLLSSENTTRFGGKHFKPNDLNSEYVIFKKNDCLNIVGNFTSDWVLKNFYSLDGDLVKDSKIKKIKLWNNIDYGKTALDDLGVKVFLDKNGTIKIDGEVDEINYHKGTIKDGSKEAKHFRVDLHDEKKNEFVNDDMNEGQKDFSGLDKMGDIPLDPLEDVFDNKALACIPKTAKVVNRKEAKPSLLKRAKEKFLGLKSWQKVALIAGVLAVIGVGVCVIGPHIMEMINNLVDPEQVNTVNNIINGSTLDSTASVLDYSSMGGAGQTVFTNAADAANGVNGVLSNEWFSDNPLDVFNTATNSYMGLTKAQLSDPNFMAELAKDPNNALLFGNSISDPSGFMGLDDVINEITKIR